MSSDFLFYILLIFLVHFNKMKQRVYGNILKHSKECTRLIENFATASANFTFCTLQNSRPIQICCSCAEAYSTMLENYETIIKASGVINSTCNEKLVNQDKLEVIETTFVYYQNLWLMGQCRNCFENNSRPFQPSNTTKEFRELYSKTNHCLSNFYNSSSKTYSNNVCQNCSDVYFKMNKFYSNLKETSGNGNVCMDIVDAMNVTQHLWSSILHCGETVLSYEILLITISSFVLVLPICFYVCASKFTKTRFSAVLHRNRLSQRFGESWRNRAGSSISN